MSLALASILAPAATTETEMPAQDSILDLIGTAEGRSRAGDITGACGIYRDWLGKHPDHAFRYVAHFNLSSFESQSGDDAAAIENLKLAIAANPDFVPAYINLAGLLDRAGMRENAIELWKIAAAKPVTVSGASAAHAAT